MKSPSWTGGGAGRSSIPLTIQFWSLGVINKNSCRGEGPTQNNSAGATSVLDSERRNAGRSVISAAAELVDLQTQTRMAGRVTDIGDGGCYVDAITPFSVGTMVRLRVSCERHAFEAQAKVLFAHPGIGMGLSFVKIHPDQLKTLRAWIGELNGSSAFELRKNADTAISVANQALAADASEWRTLVWELVELLRQKHVLTETEASTFEKRLSK